MSALKYWIWLSQLTGLGGQVRIGLLEHFGTAEDVYFADENQLQLSQVVNRKQIEALQNRDLTLANGILARCQDLQYTILTMQDAHYPHRLRNIFDPPCVLYVKGRMPLVDEEVCVAVVGTRDASPYGLVCAEKLGHNIAAGGGIVVSGMAKGIDASAMHGALLEGGVTIGVVGNGLDVDYPKSSGYLYHDVPINGAILSEYPPGTQPRGGYFPVRNRILSGLCLGTVVVEAPERSGALITAHTALEQGRDVFAVPGPIDAVNSRGCNRLIQEGAGLVMDGWDILRTYVGQYQHRLKPIKARELPQILGHEARGAQKELETKESAPMMDLRRDINKLTDDQLCVLEVMAQTPMEVDDIIEVSGLPTRRVLSTLMLLELEGYVEARPGDQYQRCVTLVN